MVRLPIVLTLTATLVAGAAFAGGHAGNPAVSARKAHMNLYSFNLGTLGAMAKGEVEYDAAKAAGAANNIAALAALDQSGYWLPGTSTDELGDQTRALPAIWQEGSKAGEIGASFAEAAVALAAVAGDGKDAMAAAMGAVGTGCSDCHKGYRQPSN